MAVEGLVVAEEALATGGAAEVDSGAVVAAAVADIDQMKEPGAIGHALRGLLTDSAQLVCIICGRKHHAKRALVLQLLIVSRDIVHTSKDRQRQGMRGTHTTPCELLHVRGLWHQNL